MTCVSIKVSSALDVRHHRDLDISSDCSQRKKKYPSGINSNEGGEDERQQSIASKGRRGGRTLVLFGG